MLDTARRIGRTAVFAGAFLLASVAAAPAASADLVPYTPRDCFGNTFFPGTALTMPGDGWHLYATPGDDLIIGTDDADVIHGGGGNDIICGGGGNDVLYGEDGNDSIKGEAGADSIEGGNGRDHLYGGSNAGAGMSDFLFGGDGVDELYGEGGADMLFCGEGYSGVPWDVGDFADGGTGMPAGQAEADQVDPCDITVNIP